MGSVKTNMGSGRTVVFAGPSLAQRDPTLDRLLVQVELRPPAARGDVLRVMSSPPQNVVLLDGYFFTTPSVTHKELLYALDAGVRVFGAASMGALRAAELDREGMVGVGEIYEAFRSGWLEGDDEVTLMHLPAELGYQATSIALVELRHILGAWGRDAASQAPDEVSELIETVASWPFMERDPKRIRRLADRLLGGERSQTLMERLMAPGLKAADSRAALEQALDRGTPESGAAVSTAAGQPAEGLSTTRYVHYFQEKYWPAPALALAASALPGDFDETKLRGAWNMVQIFHPGVATFVESIRRRFLLATVAAGEGIEPSPEELERETTRLTEVLGPSGGLPRLEIFEEARLRLRATQAVDLLVGEKKALSRLSSLFALGSDRAGDLLLERLAHQFDLMPGWILLRAFLFSTLVTPAVAAAAQAEEVTGCFRSLSKGARIRRHHLWQLAADTWNCSVEEVPAAAAVRGLIESDGSVPGLREALQFVAPAERLPKPINAYPEAKARLPAQSLEDRAGRERNPPG